MAARTAEALNSNRHVIHQHFYPVRHKKRISKIVVRIDPVSFSFKEARAYLRPVISTTTLWKTPSLKVSLEVMESISPDRKRASSLPMRSASEKISASLSPFN